MDPIAELCSKHHAEAAALASEIGKLFLGHQTGIVVMAIALHAEFMKRDQPELWAFCEQSTKRIPKEITNGSGSDVTDIRNY